MAEGAQKPPPSWSSLRGPRGPACVPFSPVNLPRCSVTAPRLPWAGCGQQPPPQTSLIRAKRSSPLCNPFTLYILQGSAIPRGERVPPSPPSRAL